MSYIWSRNKHSRSFRASGAHAETGIFVHEQEQLSELLLARVMYAELKDPGTPDEHPLHRVWHATPQ